MGERLSVDEVSRVAAVRALLWDGEPRGRSSVHRDAGGGSVRDGGGRGSTQRHLHEEHRPLPQAAQITVTHTHTHTHHTHTHTHTTTSV